MTNVRELGFGEVLMQPIKRQMGLAWQVAFMSADKLPVMFYTGSCAAAILVVQQRLLHDATWRQRLT